MAPPKTIAAPTPSRSGGGPFDGTHRTSSAAGSAKTPAPASGWWTIERTFIGIIGMRLLARRAGRRSYDGPMAPAQTFGGALRSVPLFADLAPELRAEAAAGATPVRVEAGEWLFRQGEPADSLYVVLSGRLEVLIESPEPVLIRMADQGAALGELALLTDSTRSASVRARRDSDLLRLERAGFLALLERDPAFAVALTRVLAALLSAAALDPEPVPLPATIALLAARPASRCPVSRSFWPPSSAPVPPCSPRPSPSRPGCSTGPSARTTGCCSWETTRAATTRGTASACARPTACS